jgi:hypothetical protein
MTRRLLSLCVLSCVVALATPAWAQAPTAPATTASGQATNAPMVNVWYVGGATGVGVVDSPSVLGSVEGGFRIWKHLDIVGEVGYAGNLATRRELDRASAIGNIIQSQQGSPVTTGIRVPTSYGVIGGRWVFESPGRFRPYLVLAVGGASVKLKPKFTLNGADVTGSLSNFGVTLGSDLQGTYRPLASDGGGGMLVPLGSRWDGAGSLRRLRVDTTGQATNSIRSILGVGRLF